MTLPKGVTFLAPTVPVHVFEGDEPGPTAIIEAGIHGDEIAGVHALQELLEEGVSIARGRLLVIPVMNPAAYRRRERTRLDGPDLNRAFPGDPNHTEPEYRLAHAYMQLMIAEQPALVATLHESMKRYHPDVPQSFGQTIVYGVKPAPAVVDEVVAKMNEDLEHPYEVWAQHHYPVSTSSTEVIVDRVGCVGLCVETWKGFDEARRVVMQRRVVGHLLEHFGLGIE